MLDKLLGMKFVWLMQSLLPLSSNFYRGRNLNRAQNNIEILRRQNQNEILKH